MKRFLLAFIMGCISFTIYGQSSLLDTKVTIQFKDETAKEALRRLSRQTDIFLNYKSSDIPKNRTITKTYGGAKLGTIIRDIWGSESQLTLRSYDNTVEIKVLPRKPKPVGKAKIKGQVNNGNGGPLPFATIQVIGAGIGGVANADGVFELAVPYGRHQVEVSSIGFATQREEVVVNQRDIFLEFTLKESTEALDEVVVSEKSKSTQISQQPLQITSIDLTTLQNESAEVVKILDRTSGLRIRQFGGLGSAIQIQLNGLSGQSVRTYINGVPNEFYGSAYQLSTIPVNSVERIDVYKGVMPIDVGTDALAGGINVVTKDNVNNHLDVSYQIGSFNTHIATLNVGQRLSDKVSVLFGGFFNYSDNDYRINVNNRVDFTTVERVRVRRFHNRHRSSFVNAGIRLSNVGWADRLTYRIGYNQRDDQLQHGIQLEEIPAGEASAEANGTVQNLEYKKSLFDKKLDIDYFGGYLIINDKVNDSTQNRYDWFGTVFEDENAQGKEVFGRPTQREGKTRSIVQRLTLKYTLKKNHELKATTYYSNQKTEGNDPVFEAAGELDPNAIPADLVRSITGASLDSKWFDAKLETSIFGKLYHYKQRVPVIVITVDTAADFGTGITQSDELYGYGLGLKYSFVEDFFLRASFEDAARIPNQLEVFGNFSSIIPNPNLRPEQSKNLNFGGYFRHSFTPHTSFSVDLNYFLRNQRNLIRLQPPNLLGQGGLFINEAEVDASGVELFAQATPLKNMTFGFSYTNQKIQRGGGADIGNNNGAGNPIPNIPLIFYNISASYRFASPFSPTDQIRAFSYYNWVKDFDLIFQGSGGRNPETIIPTQRQWDAGLSYEVTRINLTCSAQMNNLLNQEVFDNFRVPRPGRNISFKIRYFIN